MTCEVKDGVSSVADWQIVSITSTNLNCHRTCSREYQLEQKERHNPVSRDDHDNLCIKVYRAVDKNANQ